MRTIVLILVMQSSVIGTSDNKKVKVVVKPETQTITSNNLHYKPPIALPNGSGGATQNNIELRPKYTLGFFCMLGCYHLCCCLCIKGSVRHNKHFNQAEREPDYLQ